MPTITLFAKAYNNSQIRHVDRLLKSKLEGLNAKAKIVGTTSRGWVQLDISGEDDNVALRYLGDEIGLCPTILERADRFSTTKGYITALNRSKQDLYVDIGVFSPDMVQTKVTLQHLQAQLADGRRIALQKLARLFGFCENLPLTIKILNVDRAKNYVEAMLSEKQLAQYRNWLNSLLDRLIIIGSSEYEIGMAMRKAGLERDVIGIQPLGLFEHAITCKLGTDASGLIPKVGGTLRNATFTIFNPRKILEFFEYSTALTLSN